MSRAYRVRWLTAQRTVTTEDDLDIEVAMLHILQTEEMNALLEQELLADGWTREEDGSLQKRFGEAIATLSEDRATVTISKQRKAKIEAKSTNKEGLKTALDTREKSAKEKLQQEIAAELVNAEAEVRESLQGALQKVYTQALKKKAASMGQIESLQERLGEDGQLELTIKVKV